VPRAVTLAVLLHLMTAGPPWRIRAMFPWGQELQTQVTSRPLWVREVSRPLASRHLTAQMATEADRSALTLVEAQRALSTHHPHPPWVDMADTPQPPPTSDTRLRPRSWTTALVASQPRPPSALRRRHSRQRPLCSTDPRVRTTVQRRLRIRPLRLRLRGITHLRRRTSSTRRHLPTTRRPARTTARHHPISTQLGRLRLRILLRRRSGRLLLRSRTRPQARPSNEVRRSSLRLAPATRPHLPNGLLGLPGPSTKSARRLMVITRVARRFLSHDISLVWRYLIFVPRLHLQCVFLFTFLVLFLRR
jgi:hypothetical protein